MAWMVNDYPEPKEEEQPDYCPYCYRSFGKHVFKLDGLWACEACFRDELESNHDLTDIADAMGYAHAKFEEVIR